MKALGRIQSLHQAIIDREEQGEALARLLPGGLTEKLREEGHHIGRTELLEVTVLMSDVRVTQASPKQPTQAVLPDNWASTARL